jgi:hypothetical protein
MRWAGKASLGVVENDAERKALAGSHPADAVAHRHAIETSRTADRAVVNREDHRVALSERYDLAL